MLGACIFALIVASPADARHEPEDDEWWPEDIEAQIQQVNEGELVFLEQPPLEPVHHHRNLIEISRHSLRTGWVKLKQCHFHLDAVPSAQIVYKSERTRNLKIESYSNIGVASVEGHTVQLRDIGRRAELCVTAETRALRSTEQGSYFLSNGPFMRRFLDGYYPMHVTVEIQMSSDCLEYTDIAPPAQRGFSVVKSPNGLTVDAWFEGKLSTQIFFESVTDSSGC